MLATRIIPCLDVKEDRVVKGKRFMDLRDAGDPVEMASGYYKQGADEIVFLDISATNESRKTVLDVVEKLSKRIFIPLTVGGGIGSTEDVRKALISGADKVAMCTAPLENPGIIKECAEMFGSQCIVLSIDAKRAGSSWHAYTHGGRKDSGMDVIEWAREGVALGAGEILLNSIDMDGTQQGYDVELTRRISETVGVPVIASGGAGNVEQIYQAIDAGKADAVLVASLLHYGMVTINEIKNFLKSKVVRVRA